MSISPDGIEESLRQAFGEWTQEKPRPRSNEPIDVYAAYRDSAPASTLTQNPN